MVDRPNVPNYPMPNGFPMNMGQPQQQQPMMQQQLQPNPNPMQAPANFSTPDQRMWQLQRLQLENQRRAQMGAVDGMGSQITPQMAELLRNQAALMQAHGQHGSMQPTQIQQPPQGPQYPNLGQMGSMNSMNIGQPGQQQQQQGIGQLQQAHPQANVPGINQNLNPSQASALLARGVNPAMLSVIRNNQLINRQMNLLNTARNQQPQNGPAAFSPQNIPFNPQLGQGPFQPDLRPPPQGQPHTMGSNPAEIQQLQMLHQQRQAAQATQFMQEFLRTKDGRPLTNDEIRVKAMHFKRDIEADKLQVAKMSSNVSQETLPMIKAKQDLLKQKEFLFVRLQQLLASRANTGAQQPPSLMNDGQAGGPGNVAMQPNVGAQQPMLPNSGWVAQDRGVGNQNGPISTPSIANAQPGGSVPPSHPQLSTSPFHPSLAQSQQTTPVPRMGPTPQQQQSMEALIRQNNHASPQRGPTPAVPPQNRPPQMQSFDHPEGQRPGMGSLPFLDRVKFEDIIKQWWHQNNINVDDRMLVLGERRIDLYDLYVEVTRLGGAVAVRRHDLWSVVAAKLGWTVTPAQGSEPARSAPQVANHIKVVYDQYVASFEQQVSSANLREFLSGQGHRDHQPPPDSGPSHPPGPQPPQVPPAQLLPLVRFANVPAEVLRKNGMPEPVIQQVELHRMALQRQLQMQRMQAGGVVAPNVNGPNIPPQQPIQQMHPTAQAGFMSGQNQNVSQNQSFIPQGPAAGQNGQNGFGTMQHPPIVPMNQQRWAEAAVAVARLKEEVARERSSQPLVPKNVSDAEKAQINTFFEGFVKLATDIDKILPMFYCLCNDLSTVKHLVSIVDIVARQRKMLQSPTPAYILDLNTLKRLYYVSNQARDKFQEMVQRQRQLDPGRSVIQNGPQAPPGEGGMPMLVGPQQVHPTMQGHVPSAIPPGVPRPPSRQPQPSQLPPNVMPAPPMNRPPMMPPARPPSVSQGKPKPVGGADSAHSPPAPASTPGPSASTPNTLASPQTPKSPKAPKAHSKAKAQTTKQRRASKAAPPTPTVQAAPAPSQSSSAIENGLKRQREEEATSSSAGQDRSNDAGPVTKRVKGEWEETPDLEPSKTQKEIENIKTPEKAVQFYKDMSQLMEILQNPGDAGGSGLDSDILETLATVAASCMSQEVSEPLLSSSDAKESSSPKLGTSGVDALFNEFLDFTSFTQDDEKVDTPDLVASSSTNPSPESNAETDSHTSINSESGKLVDSKAEPVADISDQLRLGIWGELDGGESSYFTSDSTWKWDGTSSTENSWAITT